ncbi:MAG: UDP-N-acetylmuramate:L-alanyl-gamma-D-glutamyl-meso-diaminopimelate ligase [Gammaproteobacteria bacterium AqS3]|nr:UDP-N-acetylmuramate:L-alanyl-gamma-D-glutamyl-meso-diaminopimelate ligase [Gammaproteobacteria bacterium AqS3]
MRIHLLGICGTFMGALAQLLAAQGHRVTGSDRKCYEPMLGRLRQAGIDIEESDDPRQLDGAECIVIGNALSRGHPCVERCLRERLPFVSGPEMLARSVLAERRVIAVAGTHGKTTTTAMLVHLFRSCGRSVGYLVGGVLPDGAPSADAGADEWFVIEADEYDTAFFDKRSKFVHYRPEIALLNNLEFDHADIFDDLGAIERQFNHLLRTVPDCGAVLYSVHSDALARVVAQGCWAETVETFGEGAGDWRLAPVSDGVGYRALHGAEDIGELRMPRAPGRHNALNALGAIAAAAQAGVSPREALAALNDFAGVRRRLEVLGEVGGVLLIDDFAHHPSAIRSSIEAVRLRHPGARLLVLIEPRSNSMRSGVHADTLPASWAGADAVWWCGEDLWGGSGGVHVCPDVETLVQEAAAFARSGDIVLTMSNGPFEGVHEQLRTRLAGR